MPRLTKYGGFNSFSFYEIIFNKHAAPVGSDYNPT
jgi:hypothetical protein